MNKIIKIKNAKEYIDNLKNNIILTNICRKNTHKEIYKGEW